MVRQSLNQETKEHAKAAKELRESLFYMTYPDESVHSELTEVNFQDLNHYCGMGFDKSSQDVNEWI